MPYGGGRCLRLRFSKKYILISMLFLAAATCVHGVSFDGALGARLDFFGDPDAINFDPNLTITTFFSGCLNLARDLILRAEVSVASDDLIDEAIFNKTPATFLLDELSLSWRAYTGGVTNYLNFFVGNYEPIGGDNFLQRYLQSAPLESRLFDNWLGLNGSTVFALKGVGGSDVIQLTTVPIAIGIYVFVNHVFDDSYVLNGSLRFACATQYFTGDLTVGAGAPLTDANDTYASVSRIYLRAGASMLIGNAYSGGLFLQGGFADAPIAVHDSAPKINEDMVYFLVEPRVYSKKMCLNLSLFYLPQNAIEKFLGENTFGVALDLFSNPTTIQGREYTFGGLVSASIPKYFSQLNKKDTFDTYSLIIAPYFSADLFKGTLKLMLRFDIGKAVDDCAEKAFTISLGYKTKL